VSVAAAIPEAVPGASPAPPAYPRPLTLRPAPTGEPNAARELAASYRALAEALDDAARRCANVLDQVATGWRGEGSDTLRTAAAAIAHDAAASAHGLRGVADQLDRYAHHLEAARHHHRWCIGRLVAVGAVVAVSAAAIVVTVGAAAPVGSIAAAEVAEAVAGAEGAAAAASAAESATAGVLGNCSELLSGLRGLAAVLRPHLVQGLVSAGSEIGTELADDGHVDPQRLAVATLGGVAFSAAGGTALAAVRGSAGYEAASAEGRLAAESLALGATGAAFAAGRDYVDGKRVDVRDWVTAGLSGGLLHGWSALARQPVGSVAVTAPTVTGQRLDELLSRVRLDLHEGGGGHTMARHVGKSAAWLAGRVASEQRVAASSFFGRDYAERAVRAALVAHEPELRRDLAETGVAYVRHELPSPAGHVVHDDGTRSLSRIVCVKLRRAGDTVRIITAYLEERQDVPGARLCRSSEKQG
jgi:uncharacterized protein YukE